MLDSLGLICLDYWIAWYGRSVVFGNWFSLVPWFLLLTLMRWYLMMSVAFIIKSMTSFLGFGWKAHYRMSGSRYIDG